MENSDVPALLSDIERFRLINEQNLMTILSHNCSTAVGRAYDFSSINSIEDFQKRIPLTAAGRTFPYEDCCAYPLFCSLSSSGTTGRSKKLGLSREALRRYGDLLYTLPLQFSGASPGKLLHVNIFRPLEENSILSEAYYHYYTQEKILSFDSFLGGRACMVSGQKVHTAYVKLWLALSAEDLEGIFSTFRYDILLMMNELTEIWEGLLLDMERGIPSEPLPQPIMQVLESTRISKERLAFLRKEFSRGFGTPILPRIFPRLKMVCGIGGQLFSAYDRALERYSGDIPRHYFAYGQSECLCGIALSMNSDEYTLLPRNAFYELRSIKSGKICLPQSGKIGEQYELVLTTFSGLYRYCNGDVVEITGFDGESPRIRICDRLCHMLNIDGEKLTEPQISRAMEMLLSEYKIPMNTYFLGTDGRSIPSMYVLFLDIPEGVITPDPKILAERLDELLKSVNWDYKDLRDLSLIGKPICYRLGHGLIREMQKLGQSKPGIILTEQRLQYLLSALKEGCEKEERHQ